MGVMDEIELVDRSLSHLRNIGVKLALVCDVSSTDGTVDVLERHRQDGFVRYVQITQDDALEDVLPELVAGVEADWLIFLDADEFPLPASGVLANTTALAQADVVTIPRYNVPLSPRGPALPATLAPDSYGELLVVANPLEGFWNLLEQQPELSWTLSPIVPRVMARPPFVGRIPWGVHDVVPPEGRTPRRETATDLVIAHVPFTTPRRFAHKVENIKRLFAGDPEVFAEGTALHWRRWIRLSDEGRLDAEFSRMVFDEGAFDALRASGHVRSVADLFES